jgi:5-oxoprolinase (ATP-hydrolysing)
MTKIKETAAEALKLALSPFGKSSFRAMEKLDDGHMIAVQIHLDNKADKLLTFDFSGSSAVHPNNLNANISIVYSAVLYVLRILCNKEIPLNDGLMKHVAIELPQSSFLHPQFSDLPELCPAVVGGNTEVSQRIVDTLLKALEPVTKVACSQGTMNNFLFGNEKFGYYETIGGGAGAGLGFNGRSAVHQHMTNTKITDPEELEFRYPVRLERFEIRQGSGGLGVWQGGDGIIREFTFLEPADMTIISQHRDELPYGINGGKPGKKGEQYVIRCNGKREELKGVDSLRIEEGDRMVIETPGGGGAGTPE